MKILNYANKLYASRIGRINYFFGILFFCVMFLILSSILRFVFSFGSEQFGNSIPYITLYILLFSILFILFTTYTTSLIIRRLHDISMSGWYILILFFVPVANLFVAFILLFKKGLVEKNSYGEQSKASFLRSIFSIE
jgi:uncharacterized membrane protein YhaH (DUF805 family)